MNWVKYKIFFAVIMLGFLAVSAAWITAGAITGEVTPSNVFSFNALSPKGVAGGVIIPACGDSPIGPSISVNPNVITAGGSATLTWSAPGAASCTGSASPVSSQWRGSVAFPGSKKVSPLQTTTYTITCNTGTASTLLRVGIVEEVSP